LIGHNQQAVKILREHGACDVSYGIPGLARFRANVFIQRGSCAVVMRVIPTAIPEFAALGLPASLKEISGLRDGLVLVTGPRGSGKSSTLAALLDGINERRVCHVITIEDPIEFLHNHKRATIHQRELHSDAPNFPLALRAALRQAPDVILLGELRDRETIEMAIEAAECGHLVLSGVNATDAAKTIQRLAGAFAHGEHKSIRTRLAKTLRYVVSQQLIPRQNGRGRVAAFEIFRKTPRNMGLIECGPDGDGELLDAIRMGAAEGMQDFDHAIAALVKADEVDVETGLAYATNPEEVRKLLAAS
jgi:twitching motility protein PilT